MKKKIILTALSSLVLLGTGTTVSASATHAVTSMHNISHSSRMVLQNYRSHKNNKRMYKLVRKYNGRYAMRSVHYVHSFTKFTLLKSAKVSGKLYYYVKSPKGYTGWIWHGYLGLPTSYTNGSGKVIIKANGINFYNHVNKGDYKSHLNHYGRNYRNRTMQINKLAKKQGTGGYYLRVKYNGKTWGWIHQNGVTYKGIKTTYTAISDKTTVTIKSNATNGFFNHVNGGNYLNHLSHYGKNYRGKKFTTDMKAKKTGTSGYYYRVYYNGKNYGWIHEEALIITSRNSNTTDANNVSSSTPTNDSSTNTPSNGGSSTNANNTSSKPVSPNSSSHTNSSSQPSTSSSSNTTSSSDSYVEPHFDDINISEIKKDIVKDINAYRVAQAKQEGVTDLNGFYNIWY